MIQTEQIDGARGWADTQDGVNGEIGDPFFSVPTSWAGTSILPRGAFAAVAVDGELASLVGDYVRVSFKGRRIKVYIIGSIESSEYPLILTRRAYAALSTLPTSELSVRVDVLL